MRDLAQVAVDEAGATDVAHGKVLPVDALGVEGPGPWAVLGPDGRLLAVYEPHRAATVKPGSSSPPPRLGRGWRCCATSRPAACGRAGSVVTIGAYDGVHLGHRAVIAEVRSRAAAAGLRSAVVTFDRHPPRWCAPSRPLAC